MLLTASESNVVQAFDAATGKELWRRSVGRPVPRSALPCGNINPLGITGTPVIDPSSQAIYFDAAVDGTDGPHHEVFALSLKDGSVLRGWPVDVGSALQKAGKQFDPRTQNQRTALTLLDGMVYAGYSGHYGDCGDYHGWVVGIATADPRKVTSWSTQARGGGILAPGGIASDGRDLFVATGNTLDASSWSGGEAVFRLAPDLHPSTVKRDFFAPPDWRALDTRDADLGGTNPLPLNIGTGSDAQALVLALGKDGRAYLLDRNDLGGIGGSLVAQGVSSASIRTAPASYAIGSDAYVAFQAPGAHCPPPARHNELTVLKIAAGSPPNLATAWCGGLRGAGSPIVTTTDGHSNPIVWIAGAEGDNRLHGFRGDTGEPLLTGGDSREVMTGLRHFQTPIAGENRLFVAADGRVYAFAF
jgi:hypothetical protein